MKVETFECEETKAEHVECTDEALKLIEELGLSGQQKLNTGAAVGKRFPYRKMTSEEMTVYKEICPAVCRLHEFDDAPIPLRVLQVAAHAKPFFEELVVWAARSADVKDPVLVGTRINTDPHKTKETYILARWGEALDEWPAMVKQAVASFKARLRENAADKRKRAAEYEEMAKGEIFVTTIRDTHLYSF